MKRIVMCLVCICLLGSCNEREGLISELDGMWKLLGMDSVYYSFQLNLVQARKIGKTAFYGQYWSEGDSIGMVFHGVSLKTLQKVGLSDTVQKFRIEALDDSRLVLQSGDKKMTFKKY